MNGPREVLTVKQPAKRFIANGRYMLSGKPRRGGIASVFRALDTQEERYVAVKVFRPVTGTDDVVEESFRRETRALSDLKHPNIVQIIGSGFDAETGEHYVAMEWVESDLATVCAEKPFADWTTFFGSTGRQVLDALAFAHTHATIHRDVKPSNVLVAADGVVRVCDFGISKIRNFLEPGVTLAQYASLPFAPPEPDDGTYSYSRDVFGFAALAVVSLTSDAIATHKDLLGKLETLTLDDPVRRLLRRCLSVDQPRDRPQNAAELLGEFDRLRPREPKTRKGTILLSLTAKVRSIVEFDLGLATDAAVQKFIESELQGAVCEHDKADPKPHPDGTPPLGRAIRLYGSRYGYVALMMPPHGEKLLLVSALDIAPSDMERNRERGLSSDFDFKFSGAPAFASANSISTLNEDLLQFGADQKVSQLKQREQAIYKTWLDLLSAKTELERGRKLRFRYEQLELAGGLVRFRLGAEQIATLLEEADVCVELGNRNSFFGTAVSIGDDSVLLIRPNKI